jgi:hypothetical protein
MKKSNVLLALACSWATICHAATLTVTSTAATGPNLTPGNTVEFGVTNPITVTSALPTVTNNITVNGRTGYRRSVTECSAPGRGTPGRKAA